MAILVGVPKHFPTAVNALHTFPQDVFAELCKQVLLYLQSSHAPVNASHFLEKLDEAGVESNREVVESAIEAIGFVFRSCAKCNATPEQLVDELSKSLLWDATTVSVMKHLWKEQGKMLTASDCAMQLLSVGKLIDMKWKLGMAMTSQSCKNLNSPLVTISLKVASPSGNIATTSFEMTVPEFQSFSKQMKEMASMLDTA
ncbi:COMM domain-containing protein 6-like [Anneissia japonica]|uniref:COMM domain-containing protein 6-like n=1 Tax=Anneissia japonica TaxID=1529436 RepID=UPI001425994A|nr:COMM domain-containing protein 6-like [Anneissia japonica]